MNMPKYQKRKDRYHMKPKSLSDLARGVLARHNIGKQVTSSMIVQSVNAFIDSHTPNHVQRDARALSITNGFLRIACKNPAASYAMQEHLHDIELSLKQQFPNIEIYKISCILNQDPWLKYE